VASAAELRELDDEELELRLAEYRRELLNLRFQHATGQLDNSARLGQVRRDLARVLTILRDREIALVEGRPAGPTPAVARRARPARPVQEGIEGQPAPEGGEERSSEAGPSREEALEGGPAAEENLGGEEPGEVEEDLGGEEPGEAEEETAGAAARRRGRLRRWRHRGSDGADDADQAGGAPAAATAEDEEEQ
jgi:large subunit ribosomal protein L29